MSWVFKKDLTEELGLRPLTWRDGLWWERLGWSVLTAALGGALWWWVLSEWLGFSLGPVALLVLGYLSLFSGFVAMAEERFETDLPRWPRRDDPCSASIKRPPSRTPGSRRSGRPGCPTAPARRGGPGARSRSRV